jgi:hypothetical protein
MLAELRLRSFAGLPIAYATLINNYAVRPCFELKQKLTVVG